MSKNTIVCTFCGIMVKKSILSSHYSRMHKQPDLGIWPSPNRHSPPERHVVDDCLMCLEKHGTKLLPCKHTHSCKGCLVTWWKQSYHSPRCPVCIQNVEKIYNEGTPDKYTLKSWHKWRNRSLGINIFDRPILLR